MSIEVERNGIEYSAVQYIPEGDWIDQLANLGLTFNYSTDDEDGIRIGSWYIEPSNYIIVNDDSEIVDVRSAVAFIKMYDVINTEVETITFKIEDLKQYISSLSREKDEYWVSEQQFIADEFSAFFRYLRLPGYKAIGNFTNHIRDEE